MTKVATTAWTWALTLVFSCTSAVAKEPPPKDAGGAPVASQVVVRRQTSLRDAIRLVVQRASGLGPDSGVTIVVDPTPAVRAAAGEIAEGLSALSTLGDRPRNWQVAPLGGSLSARIDDPAALRTAIDSAFRRHVAPVKGATDTLAMLRRSVKHAAGDGGLVVYLAHANFEDDVDLEGFILEMRAAKRVLSVIGPEAAFERCWSDVFIGFERGEDARGGRLGEPLPGVGNSPFGPQDSAQPWHGGDTAYPLFPYRFSLGLDWETTFHPPWRHDGSDPRGREAERVATPLPSGYGPYGLMRAAGATGGCYVLWSWIQGDASYVKYDYGKCDLFPPDLRSRREILADLPQRPLAQALLQVWGSTVDPMTNALFYVSPPLCGLIPCAMTWQHGGFSAIGIFYSPSERDSEVQEARQVLSTIDGCRRTLEEALSTTGDPKDDVDRRLRADVHLLLQAFETVRFHVSEYVLWSEALTKASWKVARTRSPYVESQWWIDQAEDWEPVTTMSVPIRDSVAGKGLVASREAFLKRYRGTPFGAMVAKNRVSTFKLDVIDLTLTGPVDEPRKPGKGSSTGPSTPPPGGGSTGTPGPTTGGK